MRDAESLARKLEKLSKNKKALRKTNQKEDSSNNNLPIVGEIIPFPNKHPKNKSIMPVSILRSALFGIVKRGARKEFKVNSQSMKGESIMSWSGYDIRYSGFQLDQADLDVWMACLELTSPHGFGAVVKVTPYQILEVMGRKKKGKQTYEWLHKSIQRLQHANIEIDHESSLYKGHLIDSFIKCKSDNSYQMRLNPELSYLFENGYSALEKEIRNKLKGDLPKWLYGYVTGQK